MLTHAILRGRAITVATWLIIATTACTVSAETVTKPPGPTDVPSSVTATVETTTVTDAEYLSPTRVPTESVRSTATPTEPRRSSPTTAPPPSQPHDRNVEQVGFNGCSGAGPVTFAVSPMRYEDVLHMLPYGMLAGAHVTPIDHMYFEPADRSLGGMCTRCGRYRTV